MGPELSLNPQQGPSVVRIGMRQLVAFTLADHACQDLEQIAPAIVEMRVRVGVMVKQRSSTCISPLGASRPRG